MSTGAVKDWRSDFGIEGRNPPTFFSCLEDINATGAAAPQPHVLRRAFENLKLDGILCQDNVPVIYFCEMDQINPEEVVKLHRKFWNQGVAPILVLITPDEVHIYSGLSQPNSDPTSDTVAGFIEKIGRVAAELQKFIISVESGEYFHTHRRSFDPQQRVDRNLLRNLQSARQLLDEVQTVHLEPYVLDALLCRLVFTCYLFDRKVIDRKYLEDIGIQDAKHLRDILGRKSKKEAKAYLYKLFAQLGQDFNGDLFSDDLKAEAQQVSTDHLDILNKFFQGSTGQHLKQQPFWPYDFGIIPIETISSIYEHFLKAAGVKEKKEAGAFFTPRFLAEIVLDQALDGVQSLLGKRFLDPACGSGIFLVGLFNRLAEEWSQVNPGAEYDAKLKGLTQILKTNLFGIDKNQTACLITAFSLYLALLDQISPPDIQKVLRKIKVLPRLITGGKDHSVTIHCANFFTKELDLPEKMDFVIGNPPWAEVKNNDPASDWCKAQKNTFPGRQLATAFVWKAPHHLEHSGRVCFVLPYGVLFNHSNQAIEFQKEWIIRHTLDNVLNLADLRWFLFEEAVHPALVVRYRKEPPSNSQDRIKYLVPKTDWAVAQAELISVLPQDRSRLTIRELLDNLNGDDAPCIWKEQFWATPRDRRLLDRMSLLPRLRDIVGQPSRQEDKRWLIAEGFQPLGKNDDPKKCKLISLPSRLFIKARSPNLNLFLLKEECNELESHEINVRNRSNINTEIYLAPHVLVTKGLKRSAFADFDVSFRHALRGIHGPKEDRKLLLFLAAYLQTSLAQFFLFHTSSNWGVYRDEVHVEELLRLPFPLPDQTHNPKRRQQIVDEIARLVTDAAKQASKTFIDRQDIVLQAVSTAEKLIEEYFDIDDIERILISDTMNIIIPSIQPARTAVDIPSLKQATEEQREEYTRFLCETLNNWASKEYRVYGKSVLDGALGVGMVVLEKTRRGENTSHLDGLTKDIIKTLHSLQHGAARRSSTIELVRGLKLFDKTLLYITKPIGQRFWTRTAALNDADEIAGTILMRPAKGDA